MLNRLGNWSQTWAMLWQCSKNIKTDEDYCPPYDSPPPITPHHPLSCLSSPYPSSPPSPIPGTWCSKACCRTLLLLSHYLLPLSPWLFNSWRHPSSHGWTIYPHLPITFYMPPSSKASQPIRHSMPYPTSCYDSTFSPMDLALFLQCILSYLTATRDYLITRYAYLFIYFLMRSTISPMLA